MSYSPALMPRKGRSWRMTILPDDARRSRPSSELRERLNVHIGTSIRLYDTGTGANSALRSHPQSRMGRAGLSYGSDNRKALPLLLDWTVSSAPSCRDIPLTNA